MSELSVEESIAKTYRATRRLFVDRERERIVEEGSPEAAFLLAAEGQEVSEEDARKYGLLKDAEEGESGDRAAGPDDTSDADTPNPAPRKGAGKAAAKKGK